MSAGMTNQAIPATTMLPIIQNAAKKLSMPPRLDLGWNSAKYDHTIGILPPTLRREDILVYWRVTGVPKETEYPTDFFYNSWLKLYVNKHLAWQVRKSTFPSVQHSDETILIAKDQFCEQTQQTLLSSKPRKIERKKAS